MGGLCRYIRPGERTAEYLDYVCHASQLLSGYLTFVCLVPEFFISKVAIGYILGGTSLLIVVTVTMDTVAQVQGYLIAHQYGDLIKKSQLRGRRR